MPNSNKHSNPNFQTPVSDNSDKSFYTPDRNTPKEEWKIIEVKTATKTTFTIPELNARIDVATHQINSNQKKNAKKPYVILEKVCPRKPGYIIIDDDTRYGDPHAIAVVKTGSDDENNDELLERVANCLIRLNNTIQRIITIKNNSANSQLVIGRFEEKTRINHKKALAFEIKALETELEYLKGHNPTLAEKIESLVNEMIINYESYKNLACSTPTSQKNTDPYAPFETLKVPSSLSDRVRIGDQKQFPFPHINFRNGSNLKPGGNSYLPCGLFGDNSEKESYCEENKENNDNNSYRPF